MLVQLCGNAIYIHGFNKHTRLSSRPEEKIRSLADGIWNSSSETGHTATEMNAV